MTFGGQAKIPAGTKNRIILSSRARVQRGPSRINESLGISGLSSAVTFRNPFPGEISRIPFPPFEGGQLFPAQLGYILERAWQWLFGIRRDS